MASAGDVSIEAELTSSIIYAVVFPTLAADCQEEAASQGFIT